MNERECLAVADDTGAVALISTVDGDLLKEFTNHENICSAARFRPKWPNQLISVGLDCRLFVTDWEADDDAPFNTFEMASLLAPTEAYANLLSRVNGNGDTNAESNAANRASLRVSMVFLLWKCNLLSLSALKDIW